MARLKKGRKFVCVPCGREVVVGNRGVSRTAIWCCGRLMKSVQKTTSKKKAS